MIIEFEGRAYDFDQSKINVDEWRELKRKYKMTILGYETGIADADPDAITFTWWVMLRQNGQPGTTLGDHLRPNLVALYKAIGNAAEAEAAAIKARATEEPAEPDPTQGSSSPLPVSASPPAAPSQAPAPNSHPEVKPATVS